MFGGTAGTKVCAAALGALVLLAACSSSSKQAAPTATTAPPPRVPKVAAATIEGPIAGEITLPADPRPLDLASIGYTQEELFVSGTAASFTSDGPVTPDGKWNAKPADTAPYKTRVVVRRPSDPKRFNGTVVLEWLNVTVVEAGPDWTYTNKALVDDGAAWVGVSAQALGVMGGASLLQAAGSASGVPGLRGTPRYAALNHPGDKYAFDMYSQIGAAMRSSNGFGSPVHKVIAAGESQSAAYLTGYIDGINPLANVFDGFFVHSRGGGAVHPDGTRDIRGSDVTYAFRTDADAPIFAFETETDVGPLLGYPSAAQQDDDHLRVWEVAGTSHADAYLLNGNTQICPGGINDGPQHYVSEAAMTALLRWVEKGTVPPHADRIRTEGTTVQRDAHGLAVGGIRTPSVDVPAETLSGAAPAGTPTLCALFGSAKKFDAATLHGLYPTQQAYLDAFDKALDAAIGRGFVRAADRAEFAAEARAVAF